MEAPTGFVSEAGAPGCKELLALLGTVGSAIGDAATAGLAGEAMLIGADDFGGTEESGAAPSGEEAGRAGAAVSAFAGIDGAAGFFQRRRAGTK